MKIVSFYVTVTKKNMYGGSGMNRNYVLKTREALDDLLAKLDGINAEVTITEFDEDGNRAARNSVIAGEGGKLISEAE